MACFTAMCPRSMLIFRDTKWIKGEKDNFVRYLSTLVGSGRMAPHFQCSDLALFVIKVCPNFATCALFHFEIRYNFVRFYRNVFSRPKLIELENLLFDTRNTFYMWFRITFVTIDNLLAIRILLSWAKICSDSIDTNPTTLLPPWPCHSYLCIYTLRMLKRNYWRGCGKPSFLLARSSVSVSFSTVAWIRITYVRA